MERGKLRALGMLAAAALALLLLAAGLHDVALQPGRPFNLRFELPRPSGGGIGAPSSAPPPVWVPIVVGIVLVIAVIALIVSPSLRRELLKNLPIYMVMLLGLYLISRAMDERQAGREPQGGEPAGAPPGAGEGAAGAPELIANPPEWLVIAISAALALAAVGLAFVIWRQLQLRRRPRALDQIVDEAREALDELQAGADLRNTVLRCYAEMTRVLTEGRGVQRDRTMTPREFEQRLAGVGLRDEYIRRLTRLFEVVRYSPRSPGEREEREAVACLEAIVAAYGSKPAQGEARRA